MIGYIQKKLIFRSTTLKDNYTFNFKTPFKEVYLDTTDGARLHGIHFKAANSKGIILYFHGNARSMDYWGEWGEQLSNTYRYDVLLVDYRGYGKSSGTRSFTHMLNDTNVFYEYCQEYYPENKIAVFGRSLGGAFASYICTIKNPAKLLIESSFTTLSEVIKKKYSFLPVNTILKFPFQNQQNMPEIKIDTYFIHGTNDILVPFYMGEKLYDISGSASKELFTIHGANHNDLRNFSAYHKALSEIW